MPLNLEETLIEEGDNRKDWLDWLDWLDWVGRYGENMTKNFENVSTKTARRNS